ncbi:MAG: LEA type 2 family protein [Flavobacteriales bacterium]|nr:LEA type 2 family protein [Flavobacteriales bacterium]
MKKTIKERIYTLFFASFLILMVSCTYPEKPEFRSLENVKLQSLSLKGEILLKADAIFYNPNAIGGDVESVALEVFLDDKKVADVKHETSVNMKGNSDFTLPIEVKIPAMNVFEDAKAGLLKNILKNQKFLITMKGDINTSISGISFQVPFQNKEEYDLKIGL